MNRFRQDLDHRQVIDSRKPDLDHRLDLSRGQDLDHRPRRPETNRFVRFNSYNDKYANNDKFSGNSKFSNDKAGGSKYGNDKFAGSKFGNNTKYENVKFEKEDTFASEKFVSKSYGNDNFDNIKTPERAVRDEDEEGVLFFQDCILKPPRSSDLIHEVSPRPPGCRTIAVQRLPDISHLDFQRLEAIFRDIFTTNGGPLDFCRLRMARSCEVRFLSSNSVDLALLVNGYQIVIRDEVEPTVRFTVKLDYMPYREDQDEYQAQKQMAQKLGLKDGVLPEIVPFNAMSADRITKKLKDEDGKAMMASVHTIRYWIDSGRVDNNNINKFYSMFQIIFDRMKKYVGEKNDLKNEMKNRKKMYSDEIGQILQEVEQLAVVFDDTKKPKCWERLNGKSRKMIDMLSSVSKEICKELTTTFRDAQKATNDREPRENESKLKEKEKVIAAKESEISDQKKNIENLQQQLWEMAKKNQERMDELNDTKKELLKMKREKDERNKTNEVKLGKRRRLNFDMEVKTNQLDSVEARILCLVSSYLRCYPEGARIELLENYLSSQKVMFERGEVDTVLTKFPQLFCMFFVNEHGKSVKKWNMQMKRL